jgi:hypothetical protein
MSLNKLPGVKRKVHTKELNELGKTTDKTSGFVTPERVKKSPNSMTDI